MHLFPMSHTLNCPKADGWQRSGSQSWQRQALISAQESPLKCLKVVKLQKGQARVFNQVVILLVEQRRRRRGQLRRTREEETGG